VTRERVYIGDADGMLHAVSVRDGKPVWTFKTTQEIKSSPVIVDTTVLIGSYDGHLYALDAASGKVKWKVETDGPVHATPSVQDGVIYIAGCDENFRAIRLSDGRELFKIPEGANTAASPVVEGDRAYVGTFNNEVLAIDLRSRRVVWRYENPDRQFPFYSSAALSAGRVVLGGRDKSIHAINAATGKVAWTYATRARVDSSPAVAGGRVYVGSSDGRLYVMDLATGQKQWEFDAGAPITASPAIAGDRLVVGTVDGRVEPPPSLRPSSFSSHRLSRALCLRLTGHSGAGRQTPALPRKRRCRKPGATPRTSPGRRSSPASACRPQSFLANACS